MPKNKSLKKARSSQERARRRGRERRLSIRSELRTEPDVHKIARTVIAMAMAQAEKEAAAQTDTTITQEATKETDHGQ